jgi:putative transposase
MFLMILPERKRNRLIKYDYHDAGWYFVTICVDKMDEIFGEIIDGKMKLNECGEIINDYWEKIPNHYQSIELDEFVVMPNHIHGIIVIRNIKNVGAIFKSPVNHEMNKTNNNRSGEINFAPTKQPITKSVSLSTIIKWFKSITTINIRQFNHSFKWQRSYYDHIIRSEYSLFKIKEYIRNNPRNWFEEKDKPENIPPNII